MTESISREAFVRATRDLPELRLSEVVLQTARWQEMKDWYGAFLGVEPYFETEAMCFRRVSNAHNQLFWARVAHDRRGLEGDVMKTVLTLTDAPDAKAEAAIEAGLGRFNEEKAGYRDWRALAVLVSDAQTGEVVGGLLGRTSLGLFFIDLFFLPYRLRGQGIGSSRIMRQAEDEARWRGCCAAVLVTINFQAPSSTNATGAALSARSAANLPAPAASSC